MKKCSKCKEMKPESCFYRLSSASDGLYYYCKDCKKTYLSNGVASATNRKYRSTPKGSQKAAQAKARYVSKYPEKYRAVRALRTAVERGMITKRPCERCGALKVDAHHEDYSKPFDVMWLCRKCHVAHHRPA